MVSVNSTKKANLQAEIDSANDEIATLETTLEASANEIAVRDDTIAGLNNAITGWESETAAINARLNDSDSLRGELELDNVELGLTVADLQAQLDDAIANPNCPTPVATE